MPIRPNRLAPLLGIKLLNDLGGIVGPLVGDFVGPLVQRFTLDGIAWGGIRVRAAWARVAAIGAVVVIRHPVLGDLEQIPH